MAQLPFMQGIITSAHPPRWEAGGQTNNEKSLLIYLWQVLRTPSSPHETGKLSASAANSLLI